MDSGTMTMKGYSAFPKAPGSLMPHHQIGLCHIQDTRWEGSLTPQQICSRCIIQSQPKAPVTLGLAFWLESGDPIVSQRHRVFYGFYFQRQILLCAQFHFFNPLVSALLLHLCQFVAFDYYVIKCFISVSVWPILAVPFRLISFCFDKIILYGINFCAATKRDSVSLLRFSFLPMS